MEFRWLPLKHSHPFLLEHLQATTVQSKGGWWYTGDTLVGECLLTQAQIFLTVLA